MRRSRAASARDDDPARLDILELDASSTRARGAWRALTARCPDVHVFQDPDWLFAWWTHLGAGVEPWIVAARRGGELIGLAPLCLRQDGDRRIVEFLGGEVSDYFGLLAIPGAGARVARAVLDHLGRERARWDEAYLGRLSARSPLLAVQAPAPLRARAEPHDVCPYVPLPPGARSLDDVLPRGFRKRVAQSRAIAGRAGVLEARWPAPGEAGRFVETVFALHTARWHVEGTDGVLASAAVRSFWREAIPALAARGLALLLELSLDGAPIAALVAFARGGRVLCYLGGFDPAAAKLSPGRLALAALFERALSDGAREVDFLRGVEPYKYDWGARDRTTRALRLVHAAAR